MNCVSRQNQNQGVGFVQHDKNKTMESCNAQRQLGMKTLSCITFLLWDQSYPKFSTTHMPPLITLWTLKKRVTGTNYTTISIWKKAIFLWGKNLLYFGVFPTYKQLIKAEQWHFKSAWMKLGTSHMILAACLWHLTSLFIPLSVDIISIATTV